MAKKATRYQVEGVHQGRATAADRDAATKAIRGRTGKKGEAVEGREIAENVRRKAEEFRKLCAGVR